MSEDQLRDLMATALLHPLRGPIVWRLAEKQATARTIAEQLGQPVDRVRRQLRWLEREGLVIVADRLPRRGMAENHYRLTIEPLVDSPEFKLLSEAERARLSGDAIKQMYTDVTQSVRAGIFDRRSDMASVHIRMQLDAEGWEELAELHRETALRVIALRREVRERLERSGEEPIPAASTVFFFEVPDLPGGPDQAG